MDCSNLLIITQTIWDSTLIVLCAGVIGFAITVGSKWSGTGIFGLVFGFSIIVFLGADLLDIWAYSLSENILISMKGMVASMAFITAIVSIILLPQVTPPVLISERDDNIQGAIEKGNRLYDKLNYFETKNNHTGKQLNIRTECLLRTINTYLKITPVTKQTYKRITWNILHLKRSQEYSIANEWNGCNLHYIIDQHLNLFGIQEDTIINGPEIFLNPLQCQAMYMALFELCLNSLEQVQKTQRGARYRIQWKLVHRDADTLIEMCWHEETKILDRDTVRGTGYTILESIVPAAFDGIGRLTISPYNVDWNLTGMLGGTDGSDLS